MDTLVVGLFYFDVDLWRTDVCPRSQGLYLQSFVYKCRAVLVSRVRQPFFFLFYNYYYLFSFQNIHAALFHFIMRFARPWSLDERYVTQRLNLHSPAEN